MGGTIDGDMSDDTGDAMQSFEWIPPSAGLPPQGAQPPLRDRLAALAEDRGRSAADLAQRIGRETADWLNGIDAPNQGIVAALVRELTEVREAHGWRGTIGNLLRELAAPADAASDDPEVREGLAAVAGRWADGAPLGDKARCAAPLLEGPFGVMEGETVLVHGWSETVVRAFELAQARGLSPEAIVSEGGPDLGGRRLARRLVASGVPVRFVYDAAIHGALARADRVWLGTETIGTRTFLGRVGTGSLLRQAADLDVEAVIIATSEKLVAEASPAPPTWAAEEAWHLWEGAPADVVIESQSFEAVPVELVRAVATEGGLLAPARLAGRRSGGLVTA